jgi:phage-related protein
MGQVYTETLRLVLDGADNVLRQLTDVGRQADSSRRQLSGLQSETGDAGHAFNQLDRALGQTSGAMQQTVSQSSLLERALGGIKSAAGGVGSALGSAFGSIGSVVGGIGDALGKFGMISLGVQGFQSLASSALEFTGVHAAREIDNLEAALRGMSQAQGIAIETMNEQVAGIEALNIDAATARRSVANLTQSQLDLSQATDLVAVAQDASVLSGKQTNDVLDQLVHGITTQNTMVLRNAKISVDANAAYDTYAKTLGTSAGALTSAQKQQALMNAVLEEGAKIAGIAKEAQDPIAAMPTAIRNLSLAFGKELLPAIKPLAEELFQFMRNLSASEQIKDWARIVAQAAGAVVGVVRGLGGALVGLWSIISGPLGTTLRWLVDMISALFQAFTSDAGALGVVGDLIEQAFGPEVAGFFRPLLQGVMDFLQSIEEGGGWLAFFGGIWDQIKPKIDLVVGVLTEDVLPTVGRLADWIMNEGVPALQSFVGWLMEHVVPTVATLAAWLINHLVPAFVSLAGWLLEHVVPAFQSIAGWLADQVVPKLQDLFGWLRDLIEPFERNESLVKALATAAGILVGSFIALQVIGTIVGFVQALAFILPLAIAGVGGFSGAMGILNAVLFANPVGLVVLAIAALAAGLVYAYHESETFRAIVDEAFRLVGEGASWLWESVLQPFFEWFGEHILPLVAAAVEWAFEKIGEEFDKLGTVARLLWNNVLEPFFGWLKDTAFPAIQGAAEVAIPAIGGFFDGLGSTIKRVWDFIRPILDKMGEALGNLKAPDFSGLLNLLPGQSSPVPTEVMDSGGILPSGHAALNLSGKPEYVISPGARLEPIAGSAVGGAGQQQTTVNLGGIVVQTRATATPQLVDEIARTLAPSLERQLENMVF